MENKIEIVKGIWFQMDSHNIERKKSLAIEDYDNPIISMTAVKNHKEKNHQQTDKSQIVHFGLMPNSNG